MSLIDLKNYEIYLKEKELSKRTIKNYMNSLKQLNDWLSDNGTRKIDKLILIEYKQYLLTIYSNLNTINIKIVAINIYLKWAIVEMEILSLELDKVKLKHLKIQNITHKEYPNESDYNRLIKNSINEEIKLFMYVIANTGVRISELQQIKKGDCDEKSFKVANKGKSRDITMAVWLRKQLNAHFNNLSSEQILFSKSQQHYRTKLKETAAAAKVKKEKVTPHGLRHYFSKAFIKNSGGDIGTLQQMLGHSDIKTTAIYLKLNQEELADHFKKQKNK